MDQHTVIFRDIGLVEYKKAWDYQENLLQENLAIKAELRRREAESAASAAGNEKIPDTTNYLLFCEHPPVYTLGKSGKKEHVLLTDTQLEEQGIAFFHTNRGGDITFHGLQQIVGYPILDLEKFGTDIGRYLRNIEEVVIRVLAHYGIRGSRSQGETGVWIDPDIPGRERKICAIGVRCSRWITMHGFALNVNTDLGYFNNIIPCGIQHKQVTSLQKELGREADLEEVKALLRRHFEELFQCRLVSG